MAGHTKAVGKGTVEVVAVVLWQGLWSMSFYTKLERHNTMTLRCNQCGGAVTVQDATYGEETAHETHECVDCGATGSITFGEYGESKSGCLA